MDEKLVDIIIDTEVLVIGGGGAAITAAIAASRQGSKVIMVSKGEIGNSGDTIMIGGSYAMDGDSAHHKFGIKEADPYYNKDLIFESIVKDGFFLSDQNMVKQFVEESPDIVYMVKEWGEKAGQKFLFERPATWSMSGRGMGKALQYGLKETPGIDKINDVIVVDIVKSEGKVCGAIGINIYTGEIIQINSKAVVLATGGFQPFSLKNTNSDMTGDGLAMAFKAGVPLADMEFLLFLITALEPHNIKGSILPIMFSISKNFRYIPKDSKGNEILIPDELKEIENKSELCKLIHLYYFGKAISEGRGTENGGIYFDFSECSDEEIDLFFDDIVEYFSNFYKKGFYHGDSINDCRELTKKNKRLEIGLGNEYSVGGIYINEKMETEVEGLYAAGECASGVFGANRVADAVTEMLVQGYRAGLSASDYSKNTTIKIDKIQANRIAERILKYFKNEGGISAVKANLEIERISDKGLGFFRTEEGLREAIHEYSKLEESMKCLTIKSKSRRYNYEWIQAIQAENRILCAKIAAIMALERKESRGLHLRSDHPQIDNDNCLVRTFAQIKNGEIEITKRKPIVTKVRLPEGGKSDFIQFMIDNDMGLENLG